MEPTTPHAPNIAVVIPCFNEELTIAAVVRQFRIELPEADVYVFDNNSTDQSVAKARSAGATVCYERRQGKGYVIQSIFRKINADIYVMVDGDETYPAGDVHRLIAPILQGEADMVVGSRLHPESASQFKKANRLGNKIFRYLLQFTMGVRITDMLSGYRAFNRSFVKGIPLFEGGFGTEAELTITAIHSGFRIQEIPVNLTPRPEGSFSKIRIIGDGLLILNTVLTLFRDYKPLTFFGGIGLILVLLGLIPTVIVSYEFLHSGLAPRLPLTVLAVVLVLSGMLCVTVGLVLHTIVRRTQQLDHRLRALADELRFQINPDRLRSVTTNEPESKTTDAV